MDSEKILCPRCDKEAVKNPKVYKGIKCFEAECKACDFMWLPFEEETRIDDLGNNGDE